MPKDGALARKGARLPKDGACPKGCAYYQFGARERQKPPPLLLSVLLIPAIKKNEACNFAAALDGRGRQGYNKGVMCGDGMRLRAGGDPVSSRGAGRPLAVLRAVPAQNFAEGGQISLSLWRKKSYNRYWRRMFEVSPPSILYLGENAIC